MVRARKRMMITNRISFFSFDPMFEKKRLSFGMTGKEEIETCEADESDWEDIVSVHSVSF